MHTFTVLPRGMGCWDVGEFFLIGLLASNSGCPPINFSPAFKFNVLHLTAPS